MCAAGENVKVLMMITSKQWSLQVNWRCFLYVFYVPCKLFTKNTSLFLKIMKEKNHVKEPVLRLEAGGQAGALRETQPSCAGASQSTPPSQRLHQTVWHFKVQVLWPVSRPGAEGLVVGGVCSTKRLWCVPGEGLHFFRGVPHPSSGLEGSQINSGIFYHHTFRLLFFWK